MRTPNFEYIIVMWVLICRRINRNITTKVSRAAGTPHIPFAANLPLKVTVFLPMTAIIMMYNYKRMLYYLLTSVMGTTILSFANHTRYRLVKCFHSVVL